MLVILGALIVCVAVFGGFLLEGGSMHVLFQPIELLIIGGAALGSLIIAAPFDLIKMMIGQVFGSLKNAGLSKQEYVELLNLLFELCKMAKSNPLSIEAHVEKPEESDLFKKYPSVIKSHHTLHFLCDTLKVQVSASMSPYDLEGLMEQDISTLHADENRGPATITRVGDAMPGLGIVAAVLGVVITMGKLTEGKEVIGHSVAAALVGTFLGILLSYGFFQPLAAKMEANINEEGKAFEVIKATLVAMAKDISPKICVEYGRRTIPPGVRPSFKELDDSTSAVNSAKAA